MKTPISIFRMVSVLLIFVLASCAGSGSDEAAVQTIVAATIQSFATAEPEAELPTSSPATAEPPVLPNVTFEGISFNLDPQLATAMSYEITAPPDPTSDNPFQTPSYYQLNFEDFVVPIENNNIGWRTPRLYVLPVANMESFPGGGYGLYGLSQLQEILASKPVEIVERMPVLPHGINFNNGEVFHSNVQYVNFQNGSGVRFLAEYSQVAFPIGRHTSYIFQGLTSDGNYYVSLTLPISLTVLDDYNAPYNASITNEESYREFLDIYTDYLLGAVEILETTPNSSFTPDLALLDALVQSLVVKP